MENNISESAIPGLCSTCNLSSGCIHRGEFKGAIFQCEEFEDALPPRQLVEEQSDSNSPVLYSSLKGLCMNCDLAGTCFLPKPETGVWFCNEYK